MSKAIFRYLRGELNGFYITSLYNSLNSYTEDIKIFMTNFSKMQFNTETMSSDTIYNIGKFAGVFLPRLSSSEGVGALKLSESHLYENPVTMNQTQTSERGLYNSDEERFVFVHETEPFTSTNDINNEATTTKKSSLVGTNDNLEGYISSETTEVITDKGNVDLTKVESTAPSNVAYSDFYGNKFSFLSNPFAEVRNIDISLFYPMVKVMQWVRYNGASIESLCKIISILCPKGYVKIVNIERNVNSPNFIVTYALDVQSSISLKLQRIATLQYIIKQKFPQFTLQEKIN